MKVALCQIPVGDDSEQNLARIRQALGQAPTADLAVFPEAAQIRFGNDFAAAAQRLDGPFVSQLRRAAQEHDTAVIAGVFEPANDGRTHNTAVAIDASGSLCASYRKIHLFDAFGYRESDRVAAGTTPVVTELAGVKVGLATCYDIRFPELFRALVDAGAEVFVVIAAWAQGPFKEEHWVTLARARAIENTMWTIALDKAPDHTAAASGALTGVGRSLLIDPMGTVRADLGISALTSVADIDLDSTADIRRALPSLEHRQLG